MRRELERIELPDEHDARERAWSVVQSAFAERAAGRAPVAAPTAGGRARRRPRGRGSRVQRARAGGDRRAPRGGRRRARAAGALLPAVERDSCSSPPMRVSGSSSRTARSGCSATYREASWSPFGRFVVAAAGERARRARAGRRRALDALPARAAVSPWTGTETDTRIAYVDRTGLRVVAGDGTGDRLLVPRVRGPDRLATRSQLELAYVTGREIRVEDAESGRSCGGRVAAAHEARFAL